MWSQINLVLKKMMTERKQHKKGLILENRLFLKTINGSKRYG
jgi:hypothetical protein